MSRGEWLAVLHRLQIQPVDGQRLHAYGRSGLRFRRVALHGLQKAVRGLVRCVQSRVLALPRILRAVSTAVPEGASTLPSLCVSVMLAKL